MGSHPALPPGASSVATEATLSERTAAGANLEAAGADQAAGGSEVVAAVIGAGYLGARIVAELLLLGTRVSVYERGLAARGPHEAQEALDATVAGVLMDCHRQGLLDLAGMKPPPRGGHGPWVPLEGQRPRTARWCPSVQEAVHGAHVVVEAVPDDLGIKRTVFSEALAGAPPGVLLATSTLSLPLAKLQAAVQRPGEKPPRVVGLRFLAPVVFVPFVEVTLTAAQERGEDGEALLGLLGRWGKNAFVCDVQGAVDSRGNDFFEGIQRSAARLRLDPATARRRQAGEARLRRAHRMGAEEVARLSPAELFDFRGGAERCCVCLEADPCVTSLLCGHCVLCAACADLIASGTRRCPICRVRFAHAIKSAPTIASI